MSLAEQSDQPIRTSSGSIWVVFERLPTGVVHLDAEPAPVVLPDRIERTRVPRCQRDGAPDRGLGIRLCGASPAVRRHEHEAFDPVASDRLDTGGVAVSGRVDEFYGVDAHVTALDGVL